MGKIRLPQIIAQIKRSKGGETEPHLDILRALVLLSSDTIWDHNTQRFSVSKESIYGLDDAVERLCISYQKKG